MPYSDLLKHEITHLLLTLLAAVITWVIYVRKQKKDRYKLPFLSIIGAFLGEFLLDVDHLFDYFIAYGLNFRLDYFFSGRMFEKLHKTYVPFHAWEWIIILAIIIYFTKNISRKYFLTALTLGLLMHLIYDTNFNHFYFLGYSLIYRILHNFDPRYFSIPHD